MCKEIAVFKKKVVLSLVGDKKKEKGEGAVATDSLSG